MKRKIALVEYARRSTSFGMVVALLLFGILAYWQNRDYITNFKPYYLDSYKEILLNRTGNLTDLVSGQSVNAAEEIASTESMPVLTYHGIVQGPPDESNVNIKNFAEQMFALKRAGYQTVSLAEYNDFIYKGKSLPAKSFLLTFDDGRKDTYYPVQPILRALNYRAVMFVITDESFYKKSPFYLNKRELQKMKASGNWDLEVHTKAGHSDQPVSATEKGHFYTNKLYLADQDRLETDGEFEDRIRNDLEGAKKDLKENLAIDSIAYAFPYGDIGDENANFPTGKDILLRIVKEEFPLAFYQFYPGRGYPNNFRYSSQYLNRRIMVSPKWSATDLLNLIISSEDKVVPYTDIFYKNKGWLNVSGQTEFKGKKMILSSGSVNTGISFLNGTYLWQDYSVTAEAVLEPGTTAQIDVNRQGLVDTVSCIYSDGRIRIEETFNGVSRVLSDTKAPVASSQKIKIGAIVRGASVVCLLDGQPVAASNGLNPKLNFGGIGFEVWSPKTENRLTISNLEVKPL